jgi:hypothetical protein
LVVVVRHRRSQKCKPGLAACLGVKQIRGGDWDFVEEVFFLKINTTYIYSNK